MRTFNSMLPGYRLPTYTLLAKACPISFSGHRPSLPFPWCVSAHYDRLAVHPALPKNSLRGSIHPLGAHRQAPSCLFGLGAVFRNSAARGIILRGCLQPQHIPLRTTCLDGDGENIFSCFCTYSPDEKICQLTHSHARSVRRNRQR